MYGNLLKYYGDDAVSRTFLKDIERPNFDDDLYAAEAAPCSFVLLLFNVGIASIYACVCQ